MPDTVTRVLSIQVPQKEYAAIESGAMTMLIIPAQLGWEEGDEITVVELKAAAEPTGRALAARVTYITSVDSPCALSPEALNPAFAAVSIALVK